MARLREAGMEDRILDSAFKVFGERGFLATTLKDIALGAGISSGSIYTYFSDKEALFCATVARGWEKFIVELESICREEPSREDRIAALLDRGFLALQEALPLIKGMFFDAIRLNLIESNLDRVCLEIDRLMAPEKENDLAAAWEEARSRRLLTTRVLILGVLASAAFIPQATPEETVERLRSATSALIARTGIAWQPGPKATSL
jgi:AcrR family transcriptional regulator